MYTVEKFDDRLANATATLISGRPYLWDVIGEYQTVEEARSVALDVQGNARILDASGNEIARGSIEISYL